MNIHISVEMRMLPNRLRINYLVGFFLVLPVIFFYGFVFEYSMDVALDREAYLSIMLHPFQGREEPLLHFISYILGFLFSNPFFKLFFIQLAFFVLFVMTIFKFNKSYQLSGFNKVLIVLLVFLSVFSNMMGVQLRIGYATIIFLFIVFYLNIKPSMKTLPIFILPCLMHFGIVFAILSYYLFYFLKINTRVRFIYILSISIVILTLAVGFFPYLLEMAGLSAYYFTYLEKDIDFGRALPFSVLLFLLTSILSMFVLNYNQKDIDFWYGNFGLVLVYLGLFLEFYVAFKMLVPISAFLYIYIINKIQLSDKSNWLLTSILLLLFPLSFYMLVNQVGLV